MKKNKHLKLVIAVIIITTAIIFSTRVMVKREETAEFITQKAERGTIISTISASGQITAGNSLPITAQVDGVIKEVYVKNGDQVTTGQKIAEVILSQSSEQKRLTAWGSYLQAQTQLNSAQTNLYTLQASAFSANQKFINGAVAQELSFDDPTYIQENNAWMAAEANYINQAKVIEQAKISLNNAWLNYQSASPIITAPTAGKIIDLTIAPGSTISTSTASTPQNIGSVSFGDTLQATVNLSELDIIQVGSGQKVILTLDSFPGKTFSGKISHIYTSGVVSSGVTSYPAVISLDTALSNIYPNMTVSANIITNIKNNVVKIPNSAIISSDNQNYVRVLNNGQPSEVGVETGIFSDTEIEIISGIIEGDIVITSVITQAQNNNAQSPFSSQLRFGTGTLRNR